jgi:1-acyl-sn-glycerol-3-phosphate acyltransferase
MFSQFKKDEFEENIFVKNFEQHTAQHKIPAQPHIMKAPRDLSSTYPKLHPPDSKRIIRFGENEATTFDKIVVASSSLFFVGGVFWVPALYAWAWKRFRVIPKEQRRRRLVYGTIILSITVLYIRGPHRRARVGEWIKVNKWKLWHSWMRFLAVEVIQDSAITSMEDFTKEQAILTVSPHGIFPFSLALAAVSEMSEQAFGKFRAVVASATQMIPFVRDVLIWLRAVDASRLSVDQALSEGSRIGIAPGGISEMYEGYPKPGAHPDDEYAIIRKGIVRLAIKHNVPIIPVYCFGSTKLLHRLQLPSIVEQISLLLRASFVIFFGQWGLPIPFRQKLLYVLGQPIFPPQNIGDLSEQVNQMHSKFCEELMRIFDRHKEAYGWGHKTLKILTR